MFEQRLRKLEQQHLLRRLRTIESASEAEVTLNGRPIIWSDGVVRDDHFVEARPRPSWQPFRKEGGASPGCDAQGNAKRFVHHYSARWDHTPPRNALGVGSQGAGRRAGRMARSLHFPDDLERFRIFPVHLRASVSREMAMGVELLLLDEAGIQVRLKRDHLSVERVLSHSHI